MTSFKKIPRGIIYHTLTESIVYLMRSLFHDLDGNNDVKKFEDEFARYCQRKHCTAFPFARTAIYFILKSLDAPRGSEVLLPPITIKGIVDAVLEAGFVPRYVEINPASIGFDMDDLSKKIGPQVKAAIITPLFGLVPDMAAISGLLKQHGVFVIEDFSQCMNGTYANKRVGTWGDAAVYSASSIKTLDTLGGGFAITDDEMLNRALRQAQAGLHAPMRQVLVKKAWINLVRNVATTQPFFTLLTFPLLQLLRKLNPESALKQTGSRDKSRLAAIPPVWLQRYTSVQANIGLEQIGRVQATDALRIAHVNQIKSAVPAADFPKTTAESGNVYWQLILHVSNAALAQQHFASQGIDIATSSLELVCALEAYPNRESLINAENVYRNGIFIPAFPHLGQEDMNRIIAALGTCPG